MPSCLDSPLQLVTGYDDDEDTGSSSDTKDGVNAESFSKTLEDNGNNLDKNTQLTKLSGTKAANVSTQRKRIGSYLDERRVPHKPAFFSLTTEEDTERDSALYVSRPSLSIPFLDQLPTPREALRAFSKTRSGVLNHQSNAEKAPSAPKDFKGHSKPFSKATSFHPVVEENDAACSADITNELLSLFQVEENDQKPGAFIAESSSMHDVQCLSTLSLERFDTPPPPLPPSDLSLQKSSTVTPSLWSQEALVNGCALQNASTAGNTTECVVSDNQFSSLISPSVELKGKRRREDPFFFPHVPPEKTVCISSQDLRNPNWVENFKRGDGHLKKNRSLALSGLQLKPALEPSRRQRQKNQINYLAQEASNKEHEYWERSAQQRMSKYQTQMKYGW